MFDLNRQRSTPSSERPRSGLTLIDVAVAVVIVLIVVALLWPFGRSSRGGYSLRSACKNNLKHIGLALHNYHDVYESFPPAYVVDSDGQPLYSWRVLLLPYVDQQPLYQKLRLDEPWDSPHNRPLLDVDIPTFRCPSDQKWAEETETEIIKGMTNYLAVVGPETVWPMPNACTLHEITDDKEKTILVVEVKNSGIHWAEPRDLHVTQMAREINPQGGMGMSSQHSGGTHVLRVDGSVWYLPETTTPEIVRAFLTRSGGEEIPQDF